MPSTKAIVGVACRRKNSRYDARQLAPSTMDSLSIPMPLTRQNRLMEAAKLIDGLSLAAVRTLVLRGPGAARRVIGGALATVWPKPPPQMMDYWDLVRAFPVNEHLVIEAGSWQDGCTAPLERFLMAQLLRFFRAAAIVEVGTYRGTTTRLLPGQHAARRAPLTPSICRSMRRRRPLPRHRMNGSSSIGRSAWNIAIILWRRTSPKSSAILSSRPPGSRSRTELISRLSMRATPTKRSGTTPNAFGRSFPRRRWSFGTTSRRRIRLNAVSGSISGNEWPGNRTSSFAPGRTWRVASRRRSCSRARRGCLAGIRRETMRDADRAVLCLGRRKCPPRKFTPRSGATSSGRSSS